MIKRFFRRILSVLYLARGLAMTRLHIIFGWTLRRFLTICQMAEKLRQWNMIRWRDGMLRDLKKYAKYRDGNDDENNP